MGVFNDSYSVKRDAAGGMEEMKGQCAFSMKSDFPLFFSFDKALYHHHLRAFLYIYIHHAMSEDQCTICFERLGSDKIAALPCRHVYHHSWYGSMQLFGWHYLYTHKKKTASCIG